MVSIAWERASVNPGHIIQNQCGLITSLRYWVLESEKHYGQVRRSWIELASAPYTINMEIIKKSPLDPLGEVEIPAEIASLPKADLHLHQEWSPRLDRVLARRETVDDVLRTDVYSSDGQGGRSV